MIDLTSNSINFGKVTVRQSPHNSGGLNVRCTNWKEVEILGDYFKNKRSIFRRTSTRLLAPYDINIILQSDKVNRKPVLYSANGRLAPNTMKIIRTKLKDYVEKRLPKKASNKAKK